MKKTILSLAILLALTACATGPSICDDTEDSYLCQIAEQNNVQLEDIGNVLIVANTVAIGNGRYTQAQAVEVLKEFRSRLEHPISYSFFRDTVRDRIESYPGLIEVADIYLSEFVGMYRIMYSADRTILIGWLDQQIERLRK